MPQIGDAIAVSIWSSASREIFENYDGSLEIGDKAEIYASFGSKKSYDGYVNQDAWSASIEENEKYYVKKIKTESKCTGTISGYVYTQTEYSTELKSGALVSVVGQSECVRWTDYSGRYELKCNFCPESEYQLSCFLNDYKIGYQVVETDNNGDGEANFFLDFNEFKDLAIVDVDLDAASLVSDNEVGLGEDLNIDVTIMNTGNIDIDDDVLIIFNLIDDAESPGWHGIWAYLSSNKYQTIQQEIIKRELTLAPGQTSVINYKIKISDDFDDYCIFINKLRVEFEYEDEDGSNNWREVNLLVNLGEKADDCLIVAITESIGLVFDGFDILLTLSETEIELIQEPYQEFVYAIENGDSATAAEKYIKMVMKIAELHPSHPSTEAKREFMIKFIGNFIDGLKTTGKCAGSSFVFYRNLIDNIIHNAIANGLNPTQSI
ncbi:hypothetical protein, partial [Vibrio sp.]|uniref:hypothetical protein n=1 Tax=Vibrio sp. TaxID=678 RepID=UPI003D138832